MAFFLSNDEILKQFIGSEGSPIKKAIGPMESLESSGSKSKNLSVLQYPIDLLAENTQYQHCIQFNINKTDATAKGEGTTVGDLGNRLTGNFNTLLEKAGTAVGINNLSFNRKIRRTNESIKLYIPAQTMIFNQNNQYSDLSLTQQLGLALQAAQGGAQAAAEGILPAIGQNAAELGANKFGINPNLLLYAANGTALNPQLEVIFQQTDLRTFQFDFTLSPKSKAEADEVIKIIKSFRLHAAPSILGDKAQGRYITPPDEFDISFIFAGNPYDKVPKISTCVLTFFTVDYSPVGAFSTFRDGIPTQTIISMQFKETNLVTQDLVELGY